MTSIAFHQISKRFGRLQALDDVSLSVNPSQVVLLAGPNGAGKSTLINILLGLYLPDHGEIQVDHTPVTIDNQIKSRMGYLPENVAFSENLSGWAMLAFFARARGIGRKRMRAVLDRIGLSPHARRSISGYSKGMRQRLALGIAILHEPEILILDEPTSGLDQEGLSVLWSVLEEWKERDRLTLISSHDLGLLEKRIDVFCILRRGAVIACDGPSVLRESAPLPVKVSFVMNADAAGRDSFLDRLRTRFDSHPIVEGNPSIQIEIEPDRMVELMETTFSEDNRIVESMRVAEPELEDIYEHLLEHS